jgi:hypothetical protein
LQPFTEISALIILLVLSLHLSFAVTEADFLRFVIDWSTVIFLPEVFITIGCYALSIASIFGVFLIADNFAGFSVVIIVGILSIIVTTIWLFMIGKNKEMGNTAKDQIFESFLQMVDKKNLEPV